MQSESCNNSPLTFHYHYFFSLVGGVEGCFKVLKSFCKGLMEPLSVCFDMQGLGSLCKTRKELARVTNTANMAVVFTSHIATKKVELFLASFLPICQFLIILTFKIIHVSIIISHNFEFFKFSYISILFIYVHFYFSFFMSILNVQFLSNIVVNSFYLYILQTIIMAIL